jgi:hypothetical protein
MDLDPIEAQNASRLGASPIGIEYSVDLRLRHFFANLLTGCDKSRRTDLSEFLPVTRLTARHHISHERDQTHMPQLRHHVRARSMNLCRHRPPALECALPMEAPEERIVA